MKYGSFLLKTRFLKERALPFCLALCVLGFSLFFGLPAAAYTTTAAGVSSVDVSCNGEAVEFSFSGTAENVYYMELKDGQIAVALADGSSKTITLQFSPKNANSTVSADWAEVPGSSIVSSADEASKAYSAVMSLPISFFDGKPFTMNFCGASIRSSEIAGYPQEETPESKPESQPESSSPVESQPESRPESSPESSSPGQGGLVPNTRGKIVVDGSIDDWENVGGITAPDSTQVDEWKIARDEAGNVYFCFTGTAVTEWDANYQWLNLSITQNGQTQNPQIAGLSAIGATVSMVNQANGTTAGPYYVEVMIPADYFTDPDFIITFCNTSQPAGNIPVLDGVDSSGGGESYHGIVIDGKYSDWDAVVKTPAQDPSGRNNLDSAAMVFDGDMVYLYIKETPGGNASGAGSQGNGMYSVTTDLGREMVFQLNADGTVSGVKGAEANHTGAQWEIAIPASELPPYLNTINFGLYLSEPFINDVANLNGQGSGGSFNGIVYDGNFTDWDYYPHTTIHYATAGTIDQMADAQGALYTADTTLYGHYYTTMPAHTAQQGHEMVTGVTFRFSEKELPVRPIAVDANGKIDWNPSVSFANDTREFYWVYLGVGSQAETIEEFENEGNQILGKVTVTTAPEKDECEFYLDLKEVAEFLGVDFKEIQSQFIELGTKWITIEGASSGAWLGVALCCAAVLGVLLYRRKKKPVVVS